MRYCICECAPLKCVSVCSCVCNFVSVCVLYLFLPVVCFNYDCFLVDNVTFHGVELYV